MNTVTILNYAAYCILYCIVYFFDYEEAVKKNTENKNKNAK